TSVTTEGNGSYRFSNIIPGNYTVSVTVPGGYTASGATSRAVNVGSGGSAQANFALQAQGVIQGVVFDDLNGNGVQDGGEPGVGGVTVTQGATSVTTEGNGSYRFSNIIPGNYTVSVTVPGGYTASGATSRAVNVGSGGSAQANFALQAQGVIQGVVFDDLNGNGVQDGGEPGVGSVTVTLSNGLTAMTSSGGDYRFEDVEVGDYRLNLVVPAGYLDDVLLQTVNLVSGGSAQANFAVQAQGVIQGVIFEDRNANGVQDLGEPGLSGLIVELTRGDTGATVTVETTIDGKYRYFDINAGEYQLVISPPDVYVATTTLVETVGFA
ncbi:hypothetical protein GC175_04730, partial [bacterium]|nr:hypothetical protein [bacterium]